MGVYREGDYIKGCGYIESGVVERVWVYRGGCIEGVGV